MSQTNSNSKPWPFSVARSTGTENRTLLHALLAACTFDEISNSDDFSAVQSYVTSHGRADSSGKTTFGLVFWVYPTGLYGPYHETVDGETKQHGVLMTVESGVLVTEAVQKARAGLRDGVIAHVHVSP